MVENSSSVYSSSTVEAVDLAFDVIKLLVLLPLSLFVLYLGHQQWRKQRSFATTSNSDIFTYNSAAMELIHSLGAALAYCGAYTGLSGLVMVGYCLYSIDQTGQSCFHILTCVECYLAVVHPVIYLRLKQSAGVWIRNVSIGCVWLLCFGFVGISALYFPEFPFLPVFCLLILFLVVVSFCSLSVLCVLIRPGPGDRAKVDQVKLRAFHTIAAITGVLWSFFMGQLACVLLVSVAELSYSEKSLVRASGQFCTLPSSLILPLLFLQRAKNNWFGSEKN